MGHQHSRRPNLILLNWLFTNTPAAALDCTGKHKGNCGRYGFQASDMSFTLRSAVAVFPETDGGWGPIAGSSGRVL